MATKTSASSTAGPGAPRNTDTISSLATVVDALIKAMENPMSPRTCAMQMRVAADVIEKEINAASHRDPVAACTKIVKAFPQFVRAGIKFLTLKRSPANHKAMVDHLCNCRCPPGPLMGYLHTPISTRTCTTGTRTTQGHSDRPLMDAVETICNVVALALSDLTQGRWRCEKPGLSPNQQPWPMSAEDLLPYGCDASIDGLDAWIANSSGWVISFLCTGLASFYQPFSQAVFRAPRAALLIRRTTDHIMAALDAYELIPPSDRAREHRYLDYPLLYTYNYYLILYTVATPEFEMLLDSNKASFAPVLSRTFRIMNVKPPGPPWNDVRMLIIRFLLPDAKIGVDGVPRYQGIELNHVDIWDSVTSGPVLVEKYLGVIIAARKGGCSNITCPAMSDSSVYARLCGKCNLVRFCGAECQRQAWKNNTFPHKELCSKAFDLKERLGIKDWSQFGRLQDTSKTEKITVMCKKKSVDIKAFYEVGTILSNVLSARTQYLQTLSSGIPPEN